MLDIAAAQTVQRIQSLLEAAIVIESNSHIFDQAACTLQGRGDAVGRVEETCPTY